MVVALKWRILNFVKIMLPGKSLMTAFCKIVCNQLSANDSFLDITD